MTDRIRALSIGVSLGAIWLAVAAASVFSPDMVSGSAQEHLPLAAASDWLWGALATGFVLLAGLERGAERGPWIGQASAVAAIWLLVAVASIFGPVLVTGTDPTRIPLVAILSPIGGVIATGYAVVFTAISIADRLADRGLRAAPGAAPGAASA